ncbi:MAG: glutamyl-tRNA reductase [Bacteroidia bacterium]|nr:glutamyl-tRNA reductase [Bacteroidia bacterium]
MSVPFRAVRLTHKKASVEVRELIHLDADHSKQLMIQLKSLWGLQEVLIFSTCNRTEVYYVSHVDLSWEIISLLCISKGLSNPKDFLPFFEIIEDEEDAVNKLFEVSMGLESSILGDIQISNQIKQAYVWSNDQGMAQAYLHRLLHTIFHTNKRVYQETAFRDGAASVSYASTELAYQLTQHLTNPSALVVGLGEMGKDVALNLDLDHFDKVDLCNRTLSKAEALAAESGTGVLPFEDLPNKIAGYDVVLSCVSVKEPLIKKVMFKQSIRPSFVIDLCVPRSVEADLGDIPQVISYGIDEIEAITAQTIERRKNAIPAVRDIIAGEIKDFLAWRTQLSISPTIHKIKEALEEIRKAEMARYLKKSNLEESQLVEEVTRSLIQKIIKLPVLQLKEACKRGEEDTLIEALHDIFKLEKRKQPN